MRLDPLIILGAIGILFLAIPVARVGGCQATVILYCQGNEPIYIGPLDRLSVSYIPLLIASTAILTLTLAEKLGMFLLSNDSRFFLSLSYTTALLPLIHSYTEIIQGIRTELRTGTATVIIDETVNPTPFGLLIYTHPISPLLIASISVTFYYLAQLLSYLKRNEEIDLATDLQI